jgi:hypothetical protein
MKFARAVHGIASACLISVLSACGGGGSDGPSPTSTVVLNTSTAQNAASTYSTQKFDRSVQSGGANVGNVTVVEFDFKTLQAAFSYAHSMPAIYVVGVGDASGDYLCGSPLAASTIGVPVCPSDIVVDIQNKTVRMNNATLVDYYGSRGTVNASVDLRWE